MEEQKFDYSKIPSYKRGDVISVNLGFNVGSEQGGLHYAIVLNNDNQQSSPVITIVSLSSGEESDTYERDIFLGNELYDKLKSKYDKLDVLIQKDMQEALNLQKIIQQSLFYRRISQSANIIEFCLFICCGKIQLSVN